MVNQILRKYVALITLLTFLFFVCLPSTPAFAQDAPTSAGKICIEAPDQQTLDTLNYLQQVYYDNTDSSNNMGSEIIHRGGGLDIACTIICAAATGCLANDDCSKGCKSSIEGCHVQCHGPDSHC